MQQDATKFGDARRSRFVERKEAQAMRETDLLPTELITAILSNKGWIRAAKGHDIDPLSLSYKAGDQFQVMAKGRSNQPVLLLDSTGRAYSLPAHTLPSARGQGEPLTSHLNPPPGAEFVGIVMGEAEQQLAMASDAGYGFIMKLEDLYGKNRSGKAVLSVPKGAKPLMPQYIQDLAKDYLAVVSNLGHLLIFAANSLPLLAKGKGNKMIHITSSKVATREEYVAGIAVLQDSQNLLVLSDGRTYTLKPNDWKHFIDERAHRGLKLPRGCRRVNGLKAE